MDFLLHEIGKVSVFLICAQMLLHFRAKDAYEKYIKLLISMMLLVLLASPFLRLLGKETSFADMLNEYEEEIQKVMMEAQPQEAEIEAILQSITNGKLEQSMEYVAKQEELELEGQEQKLQDKMEQVDLGQVEISIEAIVIGGSDG